MDKSELENLLKEAIDPLFNRIDKFEKYVDRRIYEVSAEVNAIVQFMELNEEEIKRNIAAAQNRIKEFITHNTTQSSLKSGVDLSFITDVSSIAVNNIIDNLEHIERDISHANLSPELLENIERKISQIYLECEFQDLVGQRVNRVIRILKDMEGSFDEVVSENKEEIYSSSEDGINEEISQDQIDKMFKGD